MQICQLCKLNPTIKHSHVIPALVCRKIKKASTGYLRLAKFPNKRIQDSDKYPLFCIDCEQRFSKHETKFNNYIFEDFHNLNQFNFKYGDWLHYFITSVTWRTLILDISTTKGIPDKVFSELKVAADTMRRYLLGEDKLSSLINNHLFLFSTDGISDHISLSEAIPVIRKSTGGYTLWKKDKFSSIIVNLAGILCVTHIQLDSQDSWYNTRVYPGDGTIEFPQKVSSWITADFLKLITECYEARNNLSEKQLAKIKAAVITNYKSKISPKT